MWYILPSIRLQVHGTTAAWTVWPNGLPWSLVLALSIPEAHSATNSIPIVQVPATQALGAISGILIEQVHWYQVHAPNQVSSSSPMKYVGSSR